MDGVAGLTQPPIKPGETFAYEFTLRQHGTYMYHPHADEMVQMAMGMMGFFVIHPRAAAARAIDRDFCLFPHEWSIEPGTATPNPNVMIDFNIFTFNGRAFPGTAPLVVRLGRARAHPRRQREHGQPSAPHPRPSHVADRDRRRCRSRSRRWWPRDHGQRAAGHDAHRGVRRRPPGRLAAPLPQDPSRDERHGPRRAERARRGPERRCRRSSMRSCRARWRWARPACPSTRRTPSTSARCRTRCR